MTVTVQARSNFAAQHLAAADYFCTTVLNIEAAIPPSKSTGSAHGYRHAWFATIVFAVMSLEANAYDLLTAAERGEESPAGGRRFRREDLRKPLLERYSLLHKAALSGKELRMGSREVQDVRALILLRDEIVHYKTEWRSSAKISKKLEALLHKRIPLNPYSCGEIFFPEQCVSGGSAQWAVNTARTFMLSFVVSTGYRKNI